MKLKKDENGKYELIEDKALNDITKKYNLFMREMIIILRQLKNKIQEIDVKTHRKIAPEIKKIIIALGDIQTHIKNITK